MGWLTTMSYEECRAALDSAVVGRAGVVTADGPFVIPVNYAVLNERIYFRVRAGSVLARHLVGRPMAFEVDEFSRSEQVGWSVLARGHGNPVAPSLEATWMTVMDRPRPWVDRPGTRLFMLTWTSLTGRRMDAEPAELRLQVHDDLPPAAAWR